MEHHRPVILFAQRIDRLQPLVGRIEMLAAGMKIHASQLQIRKGMLQPVHRARCKRIRSRKSDKAVRRQSNQLMDLFIAHQRIPHRAGVILAQQAESVQPGAAHLVEDMLQRGGSVAVDIQFPMAQFLSLLSTPAKQMVRVLFVHAEKLEGKAE